MQVGQFNQHLAYRKTKQEVVVSMIPDLIACDFRSSSSVSTFVRLPSFKRKLGMLM